MLGLSVVEVSALLWAQVAAFVGALATARAWRRRQQEGAAAHAEAHVGSVVLVRPCAGNEPSLRLTLGSSGVVTAVAPGARVVLAVASRQDAAYPVASEVCAELRSQGVDAEVVETHAATANAKSGQLAAALRGERASVVMVADSDVMLGSGEVRALLSTLERSGAAAAWVPPSEVAAASTLGDRASHALLCGSLHAFPLLCGLDEGGMVGKLFAVRRAALESVGGFETLGDVLGEDMELSRRLRDAGLGVAAAPAVARSLASGRTLAATVERTTRWLQVIRAQRPSLLTSYPLLFFPTLPLLLLAALGPLRPGVAALVAVLALAGRLGVAASARWFTLKTPPGFATLIDTMLADLLLMTSFGRALTRRTVAWRGRSLALTPGGRLVVRGGQVARVAATALLILTLGASAAMALPTVGEMGKNVKLEDADGRVIKLETLVGKPILIVYEDKDSGKMNQAFKDELAKLAKGDKYKDKVALAAVADLTAYNYWPVKGFVKDSIRKESKKVGTTIFCDWDGHVRVSYAFTKGTSSIVLLNKQGKVLFASEGKMSAEDRKKAIDLLRAEVEG